MRIQYKYNIQSIQSSQAMATYSMCPDLIPFISNMDWTGIQYSKRWKHPDDSNLEYLLYIQTIQTQYTDSICIQYSKHSEQPNDSALGYGRRMQSIQI